MNNHKNKFTIVTTFNCVRIKKLFFKNKLICLSCCKFFKKLGLNSLYFNRKTEQFRFFFPSNEKFILNKVSIRMMIWEANFVSVASYLTLSASINITG